MQRFLDGDRDLSLRSELARRELALAHEALAEGSSPEHRDRAIRAAARALALDPRGREAAELLGRLMLEAPDETPREAELELEARDREAMSLQARLGSWALASYVVFFPVMYLAGFREVWFHAVGLVGVAFAVACARLLARHPTPGMVALSLASNAAIVAFFSRFLTPFLVAPSLGAITAIWFAIHPRGGRTWVLIVVMLAGVLGPWGLEVAGVLSPTTSIDGNRLVLETDAAVRMHPAITLGALALFTAAMVIMVAVMSRSQARSRHQAERRLHSHAWRLRRLVVPEESAHRAAA